MIFPPGTILQRMYLKQRLKYMLPGKFIEIGTGEGWYSKLLCELGWSGIGFEMSEISSNLTIKNTAKYFKQGKYKLFNENWFSAGIDTKFDLIFSSMVLEHLTEEDEHNYFKKSESILDNDGKIILLLPALMSYWGIEDQIAGHYRRYTYDSLHLLMKKVNWQILHIQGLTFPISNLLFFLSESIIKHQENNKINLTKTQQTIASGHRNVLFKTNFPKFFSILLNEFVMYPFHIIQQIKNCSSYSMVIYVECKPVRRN